MASQFYKTYHMDDTANASAPPLQIDADLHITLRCAAQANKYPAKAHARRVAEQLGHSNKLLVLSATRNINWPNCDMPAPFRQDRYFYYLSGCNEPDCYVTYSVKEDHLTLWLPPVGSDWRHVVFYGNGSTVEEAMDKYDIDEARYIKGKDDDDTSALDTLIRSYWSIDSLTKKRPVGALDKARALLDNVFMQTTRSPLFNRQVLQQAMDACRVIKDEHEIALIRKANEITTAAHVNVFKGIHSFHNEAEVEAAYMQVCIARHAKEQAYDPIAGSGPNAAILHYSQNSQDFGKGQTIVLDAGCEVDRYASDVTRTIPINPANPGHWPSQEAEDIYKLVELVQESCIKQMLPGNRFIEITWHAHELVIEGLLKLGILEGDAKDILHAGTSTAFLPHGLGHHVGLEVHDVSPVAHPPTIDVETKQLVDDLRKAFVKWKPESASYVGDLSKPEHFAINANGHALERPDAPALEPGMVVTVEPGIYFNDFLLKQFVKDPMQSKFLNEKVLKRYIPVGGVRIEDDILVTENGYENLTTTPKGEEMLKIIWEAAQAAHN